MSFEPIIPPYYMDENIVSHFAQYDLRAHIILPPFLKFPPNQNSEDDTDSQVTIANYFFREAYKPENNVSWHKIISELGFRSIAYLNEVLLVSTAYLSRSSRFDYEQLKHDSKRLEKWLAENSCYSLTEGVFPNQYEYGFLKAILKCGYEKVIISDDIPHQFIEVGLENLLSKMHSEKQFLDQSVREVLGIRVICSPDLKIAFTVQQESLFTVLATTEELMPKILADYPYEGFNPTKQMTYLL